MLNSSWFHYKMFETHTSISTLAFCMELSTEVIIYNILHVKDKQILCH